MTTSELERYLDQMMGASASQPFGPEATVYKIKDKMFALLAAREGRDYVTLKAKPEDGEILSEQFRDITPGYHMNKRHWITVYFAGDVEDSLIIDLCEQSYALVASKLTKVQRQSLGL
ncbi:Predicted DNA-binding protein, MmcQ/YjbR family [Vibrio xiamenensis]|uniref:Predicted DNA-binding protein, MmcQ/YjbR family n=1 Tax=Vibrio xiamenensis TaxID=861298 RepID=A0A1G8A199_9VIBR|nr:MmcQ/YjbR family DNA-binding protein [Vibrio xiamenensis]SDH14692.1 Predicted DNA-binding protein, MmcQ/YjbR family [Vibrio xiamenensis]